MKALKIISDYTPLSQNGTKSALITKGKLELKSFSLEAFKNLIEENPAIQTVDFKNNGIQPDGALYLAQVL